MYSLPMSVTLAALTIASAASTDPMRPLVSISPSASCDMWMWCATILLFEPDMKRFAFLLLMTVATLVSACQASDPVASPMVTPTLTLNRQKVALGGPIEMTYKFVVASDAKFTSDYHVMVHFADQDEMLMYTDDHDPSKPTSSWKPGETVEYTRT